MTRQRRKNRGPTEIIEDILNILEKKEQIVLNKLMTYSRLGSETAAKYLTNMQQNGLIISWYENTKKGRPTKKHEITTKGIRTLKNIRKTRKITGLS